jgi:hypothetical protein
MNVVKSETQNLMFLIFVQFRWNTCFPDQPIKEKKIISGMIEKTKPEVL